MKCTKVIVKTCFAVFGVFLSFCRLAKTAISLSFLVVTNSTDSTNQNQFVTYVRQIKNMIYPKQPCIYAIGYSGCGHKFK